MTPKSLNAALDRSPCGACGSTEWTLRASIGEWDGCNLCRPARPRPKVRWWRRQTTVNVWVWRVLWGIIYLNGFTFVLSLVKAFNG